jgi:hypothetical protein
MMHLLLLGGQHGRFYGSGLEHCHDLAANGFIQTHPRERDTARLPVVQCTTVAYISQYKRSVTRVGDH